MLWCGIIIGLEEKKLLRTNSDPWINRQVGSPHLFFSHPFLRFFGPSSQFPLFLLRRRRRARRNNFSRFAFFQNKTKQNKSKKGSLLEPLHGWEEGGVTGGFATRVYFRTCRLSLCKALHTLEVFGFSLCKRTQCPRAAQSFDGSVSPSIRLGYTSPPDRDLFTLSAYPLESHLGNLHFYTFP